MEKRGKDRINQLVKSRRHNNKRYVRWKAGEVEVLGTEDMICVEIRIADGSRKVRYCV